MAATEFEWKGITWVVKLHGGAVLYRDKAHLGGPWSNVAETMPNASVDRVFRNRLHKAEREVLAKARD